MPEVYVFPSDDGWLVTVSNRGGKPARFKTRADAEAFALRKAYVVGVETYTVLTCQ